MSNTNKKKSSGLSMSAIVTFMLLILACSMIFVSWVALIFIGVAMLPTFVALFVDRGGGKYASKVISAFNFMGVMPFLMDLWKASDEPAAVVAIRMLGDLYVWLTIYAAAAMGWIMVWLIPNITIALYSLRAEIKIGQIKEKQKKLIEEWGIEVSKL